MFVGLLRLDLRVPAARSLKDKRAVVRRLLAELRRRNCSAAEVDHLDLRQRAALGVATVANEGFHARRVLTEVRRYVEAQPEIEVLRAELTMVGAGDE